MLEVTIQAPHVCEEAILAYLEEQQVPAAIRSGTGEGEGIVFYLDENVWTLFKDRLAKKLREVSQIFQVSLPRFFERSLQEEDWKNAWKRYARIHWIGSDLVIKPTWRSLRKMPACPVISIDPQGAFGTGGHASTRLCLHFLLVFKRQRPDCLKRVLDVGTGSGILAIATAKVGAQSILAIDIDPEAIRTAKENAMLNSVSEIIVFRECDLRDVKGKFSLILANLQEDVLIALLPEFAKRLERLGILVVSGLLSGQGRKFIERAACLGFRKLGHRHSRSWVSYAFEATV